MYRDFNRDPEATPEDLRAGWLVGEMRPLLQSINPSQRHFSLYQRALEAISRAAMAYAKSTEAPLTSASGSFEELVSRGFAVIRELRHGLYPDFKTDKQMVLALWSHREKPIDDVQDKEAPYFYRDGITRAVSDYLLLPYRSVVLDRMLVDVLMAMQIYRVLDEPLDETVVLPSARASSGRKRSHPLTSYIKNVIIAVCLVGAVALADYGVRQEGLITPSSLHIGEQIATALFVLFLALKTLFLPFRWRKHAKGVRRRAIVLLAMLECYKALASDGPISARQVDDMLQTSVAEGAVWPGTLFVLLDDIAARGDQF